MALPGNPGLIVQNVKVRMKAAKWSRQESSVVTDDLPPVRQDVGGWVAMPLAHFEALMRKADR